jgi:hypothetical protein
MSVIVGSRWRSNEADSGGREFFVCRDKALNANMVVTGNQRERQRGLSTTGPLISSILVIAPVQTQDALARGWSSCGSNDIGAHGTVSWETHARRIATRASCCLRSSPPGTVGGLI